MRRKEGDSTDAALEKVKTLFRTKAAVQRAFIKEIQLLHAIYGQPYSTRVEKSPVSMPVPIAHDPVPAMVSTQVTEQKPFYYTLKTSQAIDHAGASKMFVQMFKKMGRNDGKALAEAKAALASFEMSDEGTCSISTKTGLPIKAVYTRRGGAADISQTETCELSLK